MAKVYVATQRVATPNGIAHVHVGDDIAFSSNAKLTTYKRKLEAEKGVDLQNWSYRSEHDVPPAGEKVFTIQRKLMVDGTPLYFQMGPDTWYIDRREATQAKRALEAEGHDNLVIWSFRVDVPPTFEYAVTVFIRATSQEDAERIVQDALDN